MKIKTKTMKGKHFNTNALLTTLFGTKKERFAKTRPASHDEGLLYTRRLQTKRETILEQPPTYRSVTAFIH